MYVFASDFKDKKPKEQEKKGDFLHRPFSKKLDKNLPSHKQPSSASLITQIQNTKALLKDRKATKPVFPDKGASALETLVVARFYQAVSAVHPSPGCCAQQVESRAERKLYAHIYSNGRTVHGQPSCGVLATCRKRLRDQGTGHFGRRDWSTQYCRAETRFWHCGDRYLGV